MDKKKLIRIINKNNKAVSVVISVILVVCITIAVITPMIGILSYTNLLNADGFWDLLNSDGKISAYLECPCDLLIRNTNNNKKIGYETAGENRVLCKEMSKAKLISDNGEKESYMITIKDREKNNLEYRVNCFEDGVYDFMVQYSTSTQTLSVRAIGINIEKDDVHIYTIVWKNPPKITLRIDEGGDDVIEDEIIEETDTITDDDLCGDDCWSAVDPPSDDDEECDSCGEEEEGCILDLDHDGFIGPGDFAFFSGCFGSSPNPGDPCEACDFDNDGVVGTGDFDMFSDCFGKFCSECPFC